MGSLSLTLKRLMGFGKQQRRKTLNQKSILSRTEMRDMMRLQVRSAVPSATGFTNLALSEMSRQARLTNDCP
jgi:hypothetical protein